MTRIRFLFDEDVPPALSSGLKRRLPEHEIVWIGAPGAPPKGTQDPELLAWCEEHLWLLVTLYESSMPVHFGARLQAGGHSAGVLVVPRQCEVLAILEQDTAGLRAEAGAAVRTRRAPRARAGQEPRLPA